MPEGKKQHTVPQFILRAFCHSSSEKLIGVYHIPRGHFHATAKIKDHACDDYFYGKDGTEKWLQQIEGGVNPTIRDIKSDGKLPEWESNQHKDLAFFVALQRNRTPEAAGVSNEVMTKMLQAGAQEGAPNMLEASKDAGAMAGFPSTPQLLLHFAERNVPATLDLRYNVVRNTTARPFIISDHPVAKYNQFYEKHGPGFNDTGLQSRGLQLFFPLSPQCLLVFFDGDVYKIGGPVYRMTPVSATEADVEGLNLLQIANAGESLFFNDEADEAYVRDLVAKAELTKKKEKGQADALPAEQFGLPGGKVIVGRSVDVKIGLRLSFVRYQPSASKYKALQLGQRLRNVALVDALTRHGRPRQ